MKTRQQRIEEMKNVMSKEVPEENPEALETGWGRLWTLSEEVTTTSFQPSIWLGSGNVGGYFGGLFKLENQDFGGGIRTNLQVSKSFSQKRD